MDKKLCEIVMAVLMALKKKKTKEEKENISNNFTRIPYVVLYITTSTTALFSVFELVFFIQDRSIGSVCSTRTLFGQDESDG